MKFHVFLRMVAAVVLLGVAIDGLYTPAEAAGACRWKVIFVGYKVTDTGGERKAETAVEVSVTGNSVRSPKRGYRKVAKGETVSVREEIKRVTVNGKRQLTIQIQAVEKDLGTSGILTSKKVTLNCDRGALGGKDRTTTYTLRLNSGVSKEHWTYKVTLAFKRL